MLFDVHLQRAFINAEPFRRVCDFSVSLENRHRFGGLQVQCALKKCKKLFEKSNLPDKPKK